MLKSLWIMRHGLAESNFQSDFTRPLSKVGAQQAMSVARQIKQESEIQPLDMLVSPFARTQSTAKIVHTKLAIENKFQTDEMLVHYADHKILGEYLLSCNFQYLLLVSHMPIVAYLCRYLCPEFITNGFETAQTVRLDFLGEHTLTDRLQITHAKTYFPD